jgi:hypothetical protein
MLLLLALACNRATPVDWCAENPEEDCSCEADAECIWQANPCNEEVFCAPADAGLLFTQIGCSKALEHRWPDPEDCACLGEGACGIVED